jgi:hypothetical protein
MSSGKIPLALIPYTRYPYPTMEELDHGWMAVSARSTPPRRHSDSLESRLCAAGQLNLTFVMQPIP